MPPSELFSLREMCRARGFIVDMAADLKKKVIALLDQAFPEYETLFTDVFGLTSSELLLNCSTLEEILAIETDKLVEILGEAKPKALSHSKSGTNQTDSSKFFRCHFSCRYIWSSHQATYGTYSVHRKPSGRYRFQDSRNVFAF